MQEPGREDDMRLWSKIAVATVASCTCVAMAATAAGASELVLVTVGGPVPELMGALVPVFEHASGNKVTSSVETTPAMLGKVKDGGKIDVVVAVSEAIDALEKAGTIAAGGRRDIFRSGVGLAVRAGLRKPDIGSVDALRAALLAAKSVAYSRGPSGVQFASMLQRLGIADAMKGKLVEVASGPVGAAVAKGAADIAVQQVAELMPIAGVDLIGPLPSELQTPIVYAGGIPVSAKDADAAMAFLKFFSSDLAAPVIKQKGLSPI
jgi:molybdate transport system substrate-binding protein